MMLVLMPIAIMKTLLHAKSEGGVQLTEQARSA